MAHHLAAFSAVIYPSAVRVIAKVYSERMMGQPIACYIISSCYGTCKDALEEAFMRRLLRFLLVLSGSALLSAPVWAQPLDKLPNPLGIFGLSV